MDGPALFKTFLYSLTIFVDSFKSAYKTAIKTLEAAVEEGNKEKADVRPVIIPPIVGNNGRNRANDNDNIDNSFNSTRRSNKGVLSFNVKRIINDCNLKYIKEPTNINYEVIEEDNDGIVYLLDI